MKRVCQLACAAALFCPAIFGEAAEVQVTEFTKLAPRHKVDGVLNALSLVRMKAAFLNVDKDSPRGPLYSEVAENGALTIIDCRMKLETKEICAQHGFYEEKRHPANAEGFQGGRMRSDPKASVAVAAYKKGEKIFENEQLVKALGQPLTDEASTIFALAVETGVLDPTSSKKPDEYNKENLALIGKLSDEFWDHIGRAIKAKYSKHVSHRGAESEDSFDAWGEEPQGTDHAGFVINPAAEAVPYPSIAPIGFFPGFPNWPDLMDWQSVSQIPELGAELLSNVTRNVASHFLGRTGDNTRQTSAPVPIPGFLGSIPPSFASFGINSLQDVVTAPVTLGTNFFFPGFQSAASSLFPFPFSPSAFMALLDEFEDGVPSRPRPASPPSARPASPNGHSASVDDVDQAFQNFAMTAADIF